MDLHEDNASAWLESDDLHADVFTWQGGIGRFSALAARADQYIGYDSAGQHIAAALGIPTIVIFAGHPSPRFVERWTPGGRGVVRSLLVGAQPLVGQTELDQIIHDIISFVE
jgi:ADP-heptose:LPS heptosyltransferase